MAFETALSDDGQILTIHTPQGDHYRYHAIWLRDNAWDETTRSAGNGQRLITLNDIPKDVRIKNVTSEKDLIHLHFLPEDRRIAFDPNWLVEHAYDIAPDISSGYVPHECVLWDEDYKSELVFSDFQQLKSNDTALCSWLNEIVTYGFAVVKNGPIHNEALFKIADLFGYVRETNYGRYFDVKTEINPVNLAFTGMGLQAHTDNPYRDPVPTLQILYCLESSAAGGENMVVDGFHAALTLKSENPDFFRILASYNAPFEYKGGDDTILSSKRPMIELSPRGEIIAIRFNNRSLGALTDIPFDDMELYYQAYRRFGEIIDDPKMEVTFRLEPGEAFIVDNTRVLHARKAYSGEGTRWLQGCYADIDSLLSKHAVLRRKRDANQTTERKSA